MVKSKEMKCNPWRVTWRPGGVGLCNYLMILVLQVIREGPREKEEEDFGGRAGRKGVPEPAGQVQEPGGASGVLGARAALGQPRP